MRKTAEQIANIVLEKLGTSRWREAIRSGEVQGAEAEALKKRMGSSLDREIAGIERGALGRMKSHGAKYYKGLSGTVRMMGGSRSGLGVAGRLMAIQAALPSGAAGGAVGGAASPERMVLHYPGYGEYAMARTGGASRRRALSSDLRKQVRALILGHEAGEAAAISRPNIYQTFERQGRFAKLPERMFTESAGVMNRLTGKLPPREITEAVIHMPGSEILMSGSHLSPRILLKETRDARMLSPEVQEVYDKLRSHTGEGRHMRTATNTPSGERPRLPRHERGRIAKGMQAESVKDFNKMFTRMEGRLTTPIWQRLLKRLR